MNHLNSLPCFIDESNDRSDLDNFCSCHACANWLYTELHEKWAIYHYQLSIGPRELLLSESKDLLKKFKKHTDNYEGYRGLSGYGGDYPIK